MQIPKRPGPTGSFGIPQDVQETVAKTKEAKERLEREGVPTVETVEEWPMITPPAEEKKEEQGLSNVAPDPFEQLERIGVTATEDDFHSLIFKGYVEKEVPVQVNPLKKDSVLTAKVRLLTAEEIDYVDELLMEDLDRTQMTNAGLESRRASWILAFAVVELFGRPVVKPVMVDGKVDLKETARARRGVLVKMNSVILNRLSVLHTQLYTAFDQIQREANADFLKKY